MSQDTASVASDPLPYLRGLSQLVPERRLAAIGVSASKLHRPNHFHSVFAPHRRPLPQLDEFYRRLVHIPCGWWVGADDRARIVDALRQG